MSRKQELDPERRLEIVHEMLTCSTMPRSISRCSLSPDLQAYRTDTFEGWVKQPADVGAVIFSNTSPSYVLLKPVSGAAGDDGSNTLLVIGGVVVGVAVIGGIFLAMRKRSTTADDRE